MYVKWIMEKYNYICERMMAIESNKLLFNEPITDLPSWIWHLFTIQKERQKAPMREKPSKTIIISFKM